MHKFLRNLEWDTVFKGACFYIIWNVIYTPLNIIVGPFLATFLVGHIVWAVFTLVSFWVMVIRPTMYCKRNGCSCTELLKMWAEKIHISK